MSEFDRKVISRTKASWVLLLSRLKRLFQNTVLAWPGVFMTVWGTGLEPT